MNARKARNLAHSISYPESLDLKNCKEQVALWGTTLIIQVFQFTAQKIKFSIKDFFSKCDQIRMKLQIWQHLLKKSLMKNFIFYAMVLF